jgi:site-specific DNA-cytosine methylase
MKKVKWVAFQCLIGGAAVGAEEAFGCKPEYIISYEGFIKNDRHLLNYWKDSNIPYLVLSYGDNNFIDPEHEKIFNKLNKDIDVVVGVPICAGLSQLNAGGNKNKDKKAGSDAVQNENMYMMSEFVMERIQPKSFVAENAPNLFTNNGKGVRDKLNKIAEKYNNSLTYYKTDTQFHGLPQRRKRTFFFFWKSEFAPVLDWYKRETKDLKVFLDELDLSNSKYHHVEEKTADLENHFTYQFVKECLTDIRKIKELGYKTGMQYIVGENKIDDCIEFCENNGFDKDIKLLKHVKNKLAQGLGFWDDTMKLHIGMTTAVIGRNLERGVHPGEDRFITIREFMCLMGLPTDFNLVDDLKHQHAITQNVPTSTARDMCLEIVKWLDGKFPKTKYQIVKQNNDNETIEIVKKKQKTLI